MPSAAAAVTLSSLLFGECEASGAFGLSALDQSLFLFSISFLVARDEMDRFYDMTLFWFLFIPSWRGSFGVHRIYGFLSFSISHDGLQSGSVCTIPNSGLFFFFFFSHPFFPAYFPFSFIPSSFIFSERSFLRGCWIFAFLSPFFLRLVIPICDQRWRSYCGEKRGGLLLLPARMGDGFMLANSIFFFFFLIMSIYNLVNTRALMLSYCSCFPYLVADS